MSGLTPTYLGAQSTKVKVVAGYALQQRLGSGSFATVYKGVRVEGESSGADTVAIKAITRTSEKLTKKVLQNLEIEISILRTYRHPNIVCLHDVQKTERHFYLILEFCGGGDLQRLIRTRRAGRLSERLTRRLMRDLALGLRFLWSQELIHRDIKPQNLLLTGTLPLDELHDPEKMTENEERRRQINFPTEQFALKIADFGFARHLQTTSLAETLCGSPLYMAPEILQHQRYDAKADLWSVGTVLFEMVAGRPPFQGENHIDLLRNIQRKAVRLPPDVRVSQECVNLLRILLNRNPLSRAGFREFFVACDKFVALGCEGVATENIGSAQRPTTDLGTIDENDTPGAESMLTVETTAIPPTASAAPNPTHTTRPFNLVTPPFGPQPTPTHLLATPTKPSALAKGGKQYTALAPLEPSPPSSSNNPLINPSKLPSLPSLEGKLLPGHRQPSQPLPAVLAGRRADSLSGTSSDDSGFVMVEHGANTLSPAASAAVSFHGDPRRDSRFENVGYVNTHAIAASRDDYMVVNDRRRETMGMLSTSPGTGGALMGLIGGRTKPEDGGMSRLDSIVRMLATAEDIGRRAISVAHLGDSRAYLAMRHVLANDGSSLVSSTPMEGVEEQPEDDNDAVTDDSNSTEVMGRRRSVSVDKTMADAKVVESEEVEEMPFALETPTTTTSAGIPSRTSASVYSKHVSSSPRPRPNPSAIRSYFGEALSCYLKALKMLKGAVGAVQKVRKAMDLSASQPDKRTTILKMQKRLEVTSNWINGQFKGVLERADAANIEIGKLPSSQTLSERNDALPIRCVEELIYNHALACGREGAVRQLLGHYESSRASYRTAGLLAETLLMEADIRSEDRRVLEGYVDGFATRITELDGLMLQQSRMAGGDVNASRRGGSGVVGLIGPTPPSAGFDVGMLQMRTET